ncbi:MAG TPA: hypothetical protein VF779_11735 [Pyrinomonadaceae bacterium]
MANGGNQQDNEPAFSLSDAITLYHHQVDQTHTYWNYLWLISVATISILGTSKDPNKLGQYLLIGFVVFALGNAYLIGESQKQAKKIADAIKDFAGRTQQPIDDKFKAILQSLSIWRPWGIVLAHFIMDAAVVYGIYRLTFG